MFVVLLHLPETRDQLPPDFFCALIHEWQNILSFLRSTAGPSLSQYVPPPQYQPFLPFPGEEEHPALMLVQTLPLGEKIMLSTLTA